MKQKMGSIKNKLLPIVILGLLVMGMVFGSIMIKSNQTTLDQNYLKEIQSAQKTYYNLIENDIKMLKAAMTDFMTNQEAKKLLIDGNRGALYESTKDLYAKHKELGITHFYFHKDDKVFLRVHSPTKFDDPLTRITYIKSKDTNGWGTGIELGTTAFALRVVSPYYDGDQKIGYLEFGEEIDHISEIMAEQTGNEFATIVQKNFINADSWASVTSSKGVRNNYNDIENYVVIESTNPEFAALGDKCWSEDKIASVSAEGNMFSKFDEDGRTFVCGGFALYDAADRNVGAVVVIKEVTSLEAANIKSKKDSVIITVLLILIIGGLVFGITNKVIIDPIKKLTQAGNKINEGNLETELPKIESNDEIKDLSNTMGSLVEAIKFFKQQKEEAAKPKAKAKAAPKKK